MAKRVRPNQEEVNSALLGFVKYANVQYPNLGFQFAAGYLESAISRLLLEDVSAKKAREVVDQLVKVQQQGIF